MAFLLTHGHYDHMMAADELRKAYGISVIAHEKEQEVLEDPRKKPDDHDRHELYAESR